MSLPTWLRNYFSVLNHGISIPSNRIFWLINAEFCENVEVASEAACVFRNDFIDF